MEGVDYLTACFEVGVVTRLTACDVLLMLMLMLIVITAETLLVVSYGSSFDFPCRGGVSLERTRSGLY